MHNLIKLSSNLMRLVLLIFPFVDRIGGSGQVSDLPALSDYRDPPDRLQRLHSFPSAAPAVNLRSSNPSNVNSKFLYLEYLLALEAKVANKLYSLGRW